MLKCLSSQESSVSIVTGYGLDERGGVVQFLAGVRDITLLYSLQAGYGAHPASYTVGTGGSYPGVKMGGGNLTTCLLMQKLRMVEL
jgi:hypothetical protein